MNRPAQSYEKGDSRGLWFILTDADDLDDATVSGRWAKTTDPAEVRP